MAVQAKEVGLEYLHKVLLIPEHRSFVCCFQHLLSNSSNESRGVLSFSNDWGKPREPPFLVLAGSLPCNGNAKFPQHMISALKPTQRPSGVVHNYWLASLSCWKTLSMQNQHEEISTKLAPPPSPARFCTSQEKKEKRGGYAK